MTLLGRRVWGCIIGPTYWSKHEVPSITLPPPLCNVVRTQEPASGSRRIRPSSIVPGFGSRLVHLHTDILLYYKQLRIGNIRTFVSTQDPTPCRTPRSNPYTVGWICAITTESVAARAFLDEE